MDDAQLLRYSRHILLDQIGIEGQERLLRAHVLVVGAGGLGSPVALYLAAAGVGQISLADHDVVELTNLQRQVIHDMDSLGVNKAVSAARRMQAMNPGIRVHPLQEKLCGDTLDRAVQAVDLVLDCCDNFPTRQAVNRACVRHRKPLVSGAAVRFDGQVAVFDLRHDDAPCYACLFPEQARDAEMRCAEFGVFAPLVGVIGAMQAAETLKLIIGAGHSLSGRLLLYDALAGEWRDMRLRKDAGCGVCASVQPARSAARMT
ncbi:MAG TPA: HesA/MoeB/ThiF family protein [Thiobacillaceae bacterium]|nr:HesA/MoeB/ThiF family protein [Thiobacillaceae bacterium]HNU64576.1 HesA/MoeB/ThiF family protein [Thiobacillaceae bacterium]